MVSKDANTKVVGRAAMTAVEVSSSTTKSLKHNLFFGRHRLTNAGKKQLERRTKAAFLRRTLTLTLRTVSAILAVITFSMLFR